MQDDLGAPIEELREQEVEVTDEFLQRVRGKIHRRTTASQFATFSWFLPRSVLMEMAALVGFMTKTFAGRNEKP